MLARGGRRRRALGYAMTWIERRRAWVQAPLAQWRRAQVEQLVRRQGWMGACRGGGYGAGSGRAARLLAFWAAATIQTAS